VKPLLRNALQRLHLYKAALRLHDAVKWSRGYEIVLGLTAPRSMNARRAELRLFGNLVPVGALCFDIGANIGDKTSIFRSHGCSVVAVEPVARNLEILRTRFGRDRNITVVDTAVSDYVGSATLSVVDANTAFSTFNDKWVQALADPEHNRWGLTVESRPVDVETTTLDMLIERFGRPYYIKIDVEGHELRVLRGLSQRISLVSFEANLPEFVEETRSCVARLIALDAAATFNYATERQDRLELVEWMNASAFEHHIAQSTLRFMEIYCRSHVDDAN